MQSVDVNEALARADGPNEAPGWEGYPTAAILISLAQARADVRALAAEVTRLRNGALAADDRGLLRICAALHAYYTGSGGDDYAEWAFGEAGRQADIAHLRQRLAEWTTSIPRWSAYDSAVKALVQATLAEQGTP